MSSRTNHKISHSFYGKIAILVPKIMCVYIHNKKLTVYLRMWFEYRISCLDRIEYKIWLLADKMSTAN